MRAQLLSCYRPTITYFIIIIINTFINRNHSFSLPYTCCAEILYKVRILKMLALDIIRVCWELILGWGNHVGTVSFMKQNVYSCFFPKILLHLLSPPSLSSALYNPHLIAQTVMYRASLETLLSPKCLYKETSGVKNLFVSMLMRLSESIPPGEHASTHSCTHSTWTSLLHSDSTDHGNIIFSFFFLSGLSEALLGTIYFS